MSRRWILETLVVAGALLPACKTRVPSATVEAAKPAAVAETPTRPAPVEPASPTDPGTEAGIQDIQETQGQPARRNTRATDRRAERS
jgi:hypothetical protein